MVIKNFIDKKATVKACHEFAGYMAEEIEKLVQEYLAVVRNVNITGQKIITGDNPYRLFIAKKITDRMKTLLNLVIATQKSEHDQLVDIINQLGLRKIKREIIEEKKYSLP